MSEGVSEISVKTFYGEPAFLENNLGIEKDPKLGEIVQVKSKIDSDIVDLHDEPPITKPIDCPNASEFEKASVAPSLMATTLKETTDAVSLHTADIQKDTNIINTDFEPANAPKDQVSDVVVEDNKENTKTEEIIKRDIEIDCPVDTEKQKSTNTVAEHCFSESPDLIKEKEKHLLSLGLLSHEAAVEAAKEKRKRREILQRNITKTEKRNKGSEYTGTLKTIIKLNRTSPEKRKTRMPLKITFAKGKPPKQHTEKDTNGSTVSIENTFYTIHQDKQVMKNITLIKICPCFNNSSFFYRSINNKKVRIVKKAVRGLTVFILVCVFSKKKNNKTHFLTT